MAKLTKQIVAAVSKGKKETVAKPKTGPKTAPKVTAKPAATKAPVKPKVTKATTKPVAKTPVKTPRKTTVKTPVKAPVKTEVKAEPVEVPKFRLKQYWLNQHCHHALRKWKTNLVNHVNLVHLKRIHLSSVNTIMNCVLTCVI